MLSRNTSKKPHFSCKTFNTADSLTSSVQFKFNISLILLCDLLQLFGCVLQPFDSLIHYWSRPWSVALLVLALLPSAPLLPPAQIATGHENWPCFIELRALYLQFLFVFSSFVCSLLPLVLFVLSVFSLPTLLHINYRQRFANYYVFMGMHSSPLNLDYVPYTIHLLFHWVVQTLVL